VHPEHERGLVFCQVDPGCGGLKQEMLRYAEERLSVPTDRGRRLRIFINDADTGFRNIASAAGYARSDRYEDMSRLDVRGLNPRVRLPPGFRFRSLAEGIDTAAVARLMWRGFNHSGEMPEERTADQVFMQSAPGFRPELQIVVEAPAGPLVCYAGMWIDPVNGVCYVEPVCTDPAFRRRGLARAAVLEAVRRCGEAGARTAYVGSVLPLYLSAGFRRVYGVSAWERNWG
jgi:GNAT superfamily N-acetyltransferase